MPRIRSIHPNLLTDEAFMALTVELPLAIPLYLGLLTEADDNGVFEWKLLTLKARILPATTASIEELMAALVRHGFVRRFEAEGRAFGALHDFRKWQRPQRPSFAHPCPPEIALFVGARKAGDAAAEPAPAAPAPAAPERARARPAASWPPDARERFWAAYPQPIGYQRAMAALARIEESGVVGFDTLMAGIAAYKAAKPPGREWCSPGKWLEEARWKDRPVAPAGAQAQAPVGQVWVRYGSDDWTILAAHRRAEGRKAPPHFHSDLHREDGTWLKAEEFEAALASDRARKGQEAGDAAESLWDAVA